jgi:carboxyl-terminal processing protease
MQQQPRLPLWFMLANSAVVLAAFATGVLLGGRNRPDLPEPQGSALELVHREILASHVEPPDGNELLDRAIRGMADHLDKYSRYIAPAEVAHYEEAATGRYEGIGVVMQQHGEDLVVHFPFAGGPAEQAGVLPGDRVVAVDGKRLADFATATRHDEAARIVRGPAHSSVALTLDRDGTVLDVAVRRAAVQHPVVKWAHLADPAAGLGYVFVSDFHHGMAAAFDEAVAALDLQRPLRGLVIDLRFDGGGSLDECIALCRRFVPDGVIVSTRRRGAEIERVEADRKLCRYPELPLVLLVNGGSASASEVTAGCLVDHGRAAVVGTRTFGKGVVNTVYSWEQFKLKLTTAFYYTPNGRSLGGLQRAEQGTADGRVPGITPDFEVTLTDQQEHDILVRLSRNEVPAAYREAFARVAERYGGQVPEPPRAEEDPQLQKALEVLRERVGRAAGK